MYDQYMDQECIPLCDAINKIQGLRTTESCSGHGTKPMRIWFRVQSLEHLPLLLYWLDA